MSRRPGPPPSNLAVPTSTASASGPAQDVALRHLAHVRAAHGGSGSNTEMRAILRKERELERARASSSTSNREHEAPARRVASNASSMATSLSDRKLTQNSSSSSLGASSVHGADDGPESLTAPTSAPSAATRRSANLNRPSSSKGTTASGPIAPAESAPKKPVLTSDREDSASSVGSRMPAPPDSFDHSFGIDALQAAFSAKYYELANKCKNWERYAAKLRAQSEALEVENRVLREQNAQLEAENAAFRHEQQQRDQDRYRRDVETRLSSLEGRLSSRGQLGDNIGDQFQSGDTLVDLEHISAPSAPSSASKSTDSRHDGRMAYCSSNLQIEDRPELRPPTPVSALSLPAMLPSIPPQDSTQQLSSTGRRSLNQPREGMHEWPVYNKRDSASLAEIINQDAAHRESAAFYGEGRSSRLGSRRLDADAGAARPRLATLPNSATFPSALSGSSHDSSALTSHALAAMNRQHAAMIGDQNHRPASGSPSGGDSMTQTGLRPIQGKRRSTISVDRTLEFSLQQAAVAGMPVSEVAMLASAGGVDARSRGLSSLSDAPTVTGDYLQEYVEQRRQQRRTSFTVQQQQQQHMILGAVPNQPGSRPGSRMSNHSAGGDRTRRARSRAGSVHDAVPMLKDDVFSEGASTNVLPKPKGVSPLMENVNVANGASLYPPTGLNSPSPQAKERSALTELRGLHRVQSSDTSQSSQSLGSGIADYSNSSTELINNDTEDQRRAHRRLYASLRAELDPEDLIKFEKYVHRYDALEIGLEGPRGLINRVKKLLLLTDPDLKSKPEKLRVRKELAREFEKVVKNSAV
ncbi:hypothetical protein ACQY0O_006773 [Thecaphora frezii]